MDRVKFLLALKGNLSSPSLSGDDSSADAKYLHCHVTDDNGMTLKRVTPLNSYCHWKRFKGDGRHFTA